MNKDAAAQRFQIREGAEQDEAEDRGGGLLTKRGRRLNDEEERLA